MPKLRILVVDDAVVVRKILTDTLSADADLEIFTAANGRIALSKLNQVNPDLVTLDMEMPEMDGLTTLKAIRQVRPTLPVIMFSTLVERGAIATLDALAAGANDYVTKPANVGSVSIAMARVKQELIPKIKALCGRRNMPAMPTFVPKPIIRPVVAGNHLIDAVVIGVSTGGPNALSEMLPLLPADLPVPVAIVQHMPTFFTRLLAERLNSKCKLKVREGAAGEVLLPGEIVIAPGGFHMTVNGPANRPVLALNQEAEENSCRPAVDVLFRSAAALWKSRVLGVVLTGMGSDGERGCGNIREAGGRVIAQDEASSVVWGMPGAVARAGLAEKLLPLNRIAAEIVSIVKQGQAARAVAVA